METADLEQQPDADASQDDAPTGYVDTSIDTGAIPVEVEAEPEVKPEEPESEVDPSPTVEEDDDKKTGSVQERIDKVTKSWRETERDNVALEQENVDLRLQLEERPDPDKELIKTREDFETKEEYQRYMDDELDLRTKKAAQKIVDQNQSTADAATRKDEFATREKAFAATVDDYGDVVYDKHLRINDPMKEVIQSDEHGPELGYYLGKKPDIAKDIFEMSPVKAGQALGDILTSIKAEKAKAATEKVTGAPPPPPKIPSGDEALDRGFYEGMPDKDFNKMRRKQIANR